MIGINRFFRVQVLFFSLFLVLFITNQAQVSAKAPDIMVYADGQNIAFDVKPELLNNRTMVPVRKTIEFLGAKVFWDNTNQEILIKKDNEEVLLTIGDKAVLKDGKQLTLDSAPYVENGRTLVPLRFLSEAFGYHVDWDQQIFSVIINTTSEYIYPQDRIKIPVLMYHHFEEGKNVSTIVSPTNFAKQMEMLKEEGFTTINDHDLIAFMNGEKTLPKKPIMITMDDGYRSNYVHAYPVLKKLNMKATIYTIVSRHEDPYASYYPRFTWEEGKEMYESGLIEIQSHTYKMHKKAPTHHGNRALVTNPIYKNGVLETKAEYEARVVEDLKLAKQLIEKNIGNKVVSFCYPYGDFSEASERLAKKAGYQMTLTVNKGINKQGNGAFLLKRINVPGKFSASDLKTEIEKYLN